jgi:hypothetical protein
MHMKATGWFSWPIASIQEVFFGLGRIGGGICWSLSRKKRQESNNKFRGR